MKKFCLTSFLPSISIFVFSFISSSEQVYDIGRLPISEKRIALNLIQVYEETKDAQMKFYEKFDNTQQLFNEIKAEKSSTSREDDQARGFIKTPLQDATSNTTNPSTSTSSSFVQIMSKGPVEEETIWRALYDTQLRRSPPTEEVHVFSTEDVEKEYGKARFDAFISQIYMMKNQFEKDLLYMNEELPRQKKIKDVINKAALLEQHINMQNKGNYYKNGPVQKTYATRVLC
ncbi:conserved Plasmodium protein, unknown function [Plasmodium malariae]|uniref:Uncharacterized protein n=1 Tax=Plasmodium malariae TaxID=5858 RepID=A0A1A8VLX6_PLAMA|nr:conserved Plasmodium protein, unknown function [Plasmodium malariae]SBS81608.1 conserved Plasmodium protein, unknown function [Plasmodium malariae]SBT87094.1 conserved Plasmodium protein, unknown function [Plasmodium malariae]